MVIFPYRNPDTASTPWKEFTFSLCFREGKHTLTSTAEEVVSIFGDAGSEAQGTQLFDLRAVKMKTLIFPVPQFMDIPTLFIEALQKLLSHHTMSYIAHSSYGSWPRYNQFATQAEQNVKTMKGKWTAETRKA